MKSSFTIIAPGRRATHMPTADGVVVRVSCLKLSANHLDFRRVERSRLSSEGSEAGEAVLAKSAVAVSASHSANARATLSTLFAKRPRARGLCPRPLRNVEEKGRAALKRVGQQMGSDAHLLCCSRESFLQNLAQAWPSGPRCQSFIATVSRRASGGVPVSERGGRGP